MSSSVVRVGLVIVIIAAAAILVYVGANLWQLLDPSYVEDAARLSNARHGLITSQTPLEDSAVLADARARSWRDDVVLIRAEGSWIAPPDWRSVVDPPVAWSFTYYSPGTGELVSVPVSDGQVRWVPPRPVPIVPATLGSFPPTFGADAVWLSLLAAGGDQLLEANPGAQAHFLLQSRSGEPVWNASLRYGDAQVSITMHAETGVVSLR